MRKHLFPAPTSMSYIYIELGPTKCYNAEPNFMVIVSNPRLPLNMFVYKHTHTETKRTPPFHHSRAQYSLCCARPSKKMGREGERDRGGDCLSLLKIK